MIKGRSFKIQVFWWACKYKDKIKVKVRVCVVGVFWLFFYYFKGVLGSHLHTHFQSGIETWWAGSWLPHISSGLLPWLHGWRPGVKGHSPCLAFLHYSCHFTHFALPSLFASHSAQCFNFQISVNTKWGSVQLVPLPYSVSCLVQRSRQFIH